MEIDGQEYEARRDKVCAHVRGIASMLVRLLLILCYVDIFIKYLGMSSALTSDAPHAPFFGETS